MLPRYNKTIVACCDLGSMGFVHPREKMAPSANPSGVQNGTLGEPLGYTKRHPLRTPLVYKTPWTLSQLETIVQCMYNVQLQDKVA